MPQSTEKLRARNAVVEMVINKKGASAFHLKKQQYKWIVWREREDYRMLKKCELFEITTDDVTIRKLRRRGTGKLYLSTEELFDAFHTEHLSIGQGARDIKHNKTRELYANVTKEMIIKTIWRNSRYFEHYNPKRPRKLHITLWINFVY